MDNDDMEDIDEYGANMPTFAAEVDQLKNQNYNE